MHYDREGDEHFDAVSALMKSLRGSDPDAALHYLARLLEAGDLIGAIRRLLCSASEDVGLAYPQAASIVRACCESALQLGLPEAKLPPRRGGAAPRYRAEVQQRRHGHRQGHGRT